MITGIWLYASLWALLPLLGWGSYGPEPFGLACSIDWIGYEESLNHSTFIMALATLCTFLPCIVILCTYFGIAWKLHRAYQSIQSKNFKCGNTERKITLVKSSTMLSLAAGMDLIDWIDNFFCLYVLFYHALVFADGLHDQCGFHFCLDPICGGELLDNV